MTVTLTLHLSQAIIIVAGEEHEVYPEQHHQATSSHSLNLHWMIQLVTCKGCSCCVLPRGEGLGTITSRRTPFRELCPPIVSHFNSRHTHGPGMNALILKLLSFIFHLFLFELLIVLQEDFYSGCLINNVEALLPAHISSLRCTGYLYRCM